MTGSAPSDGLEGRALEIEGVSSSGPTPVTIYGRTYYLRGEGDAGYLQELADLVDVRMREVADATGTADTLKVAILAALNIADEVLRARRDDSNADDERDRERLARIVALLDEALAE
jgi:cell division protein ZapA